MNYTHTIKLLLEAIQKEGTATKIAIECQEAKDIIFEVDDKGIKEALEYADSVDDVVAIRCFSKDLKDILGRFLIEPCNSDPLDVIYDWTDNDYCKNIMESFN